MPLVVTQLPSVYGKNLSLTGAVFMIIFISPIKRQQTTYTHR